MDAPPRKFAPIALCLGGMDPSGGAGILRDASVLAELGVHAMAISTAETLQNGHACARIEAPSMDPAQRLDALRGHLSGLWGVKLGMCALPVADLARLVSLLADLAPGCRIWDPILAPTSGPGLHDRSELLAMAEVVLPSGGWIVAPNRHEAATAAAMDPDEDPSKLAAPFLERGARAVWLKGGHAQGSLVVDCWVTREGCADLDASPRLSGEPRGTGCALASAWLGFRLRGGGEMESAQKAAAWLRSRWGTAFVPGGFGRPVFAPVGAL